MASSILEDLKACAQAIQDRNLKLADDLMELIWNPPAYETDRERGRIMKYFAEALVRRAYGLRPTVPYSYVISPTPPTTCFRLMYQNTVLAAAMGKKRVHIIDFFLSEPNRFEYLLETLIQYSHHGPDSRPLSVRITVVVPPLLANRVPVYRQASVRLAVLSMLVNVEFEDLQFVVANSLCDIDTSMLEFRKPEDEVVFISYAYKLHRLLAQPGVMERELSKLGQIKPEIVIIIEQDANQNDSYLIERLEDSFPRYFGDWLYIGYLVRREIGNIVGCEGMNGSDQRHETMAQWRSCLHRIGFLSIPLTKPPQPYPMGVLVQEENGYLVASSEKWPPVVISAWKFTDSVDHFNPISSNSVQEISHQNSPKNEVVQTCEVFTEGFSLNRIAALAEIYDLVEDICARHKLSLALTWTCWGKVKQLPDEILSVAFDERSLSIQTTACYGETRRSKKFMEACARHPLVVGQAIGGKVLQSYDTFFTLDITKFDKCEYPFTSAACKFGSHAAVAIGLWNNYVVGDVYVLEFYFPSANKGLEELKLLKDRILHDLENMKRIFVTPRVHGISNIPVPVVMPMGSTPPASSIPDVTRSLNTAELSEGHEQVVRKKSCILEPILNIDGEMVKANGDISILPRTRQRKLVSKVWEHFTKLEENGLKRAQCKYCNKKFPGSSKSGTTHLRNHLERCQSRKKEYPELQLKFPTENANEGNSNTFDQETSHLDLANLILKHQYLLDMVEDESFKNFLNNLQPMFELPSREVILSGIWSIYKEEKEKLHHYFDQLACNFSLTIGLWKDNLRENAYCYLMAHFIDDDWELKKRLLAFKILEHSYPDTETLCGIIRNSLSEWNMSGKVCSIIVDNFSVNDDIVEQLKENCLNRKGCLPSGGCYINFTLIRDELHEIDDVLLKMRKSIEYFNGTFGKSQDAVNQVKLRGGDSRDDCPLRFNSNFDMLASKEEWDEGLVMHRFLKDSYETLNSSGGTQSLTANVYFPKLCELYKKFLPLEKSDYPCMKLMKMKFDNHWRICNLVFAVAAVLDPRLKFKLVEFACRDIFGDHDSKMHLKEFRNALSDVYDEYDNGRDKLTTPASIYGHSSCSTTHSSGDSMLKSFSRYASARNFYEVASWKSELDCYLEEPLLRSDADDELFDTLGWWRTNSQKFPTLARMARDILAIPAVTPDSFFSTMKTNLSYSDLGAEILEAFICNQDWLETPKTNNRTNHANLQLTAKRKMEEKGTCEVKNCKQSKCNAEEINDQVKAKSSYETPADETTWSKEIMMTEQRAWSEKDIRAYLVSAFTEDEKKHLETWQSPLMRGDLAVRGKMRNVPSTSLAPLLSIPCDKESREEYYIDDSVVNAFFELLKRRAEKVPNMFVKHYSFDSFIATFLIEKRKTESELLSWVKIEELQDAEKLFLPVSFSKHWMLFYVDTKKQKLSWLDSNRSSQMYNKDVKEAISGWFRRSLLPLLGYDNAVQWPFQVPTDIPMQENSVDCALFVMKYADCLTHNDCFPFSQQDMAHFRHRTLLDIYQGEFRTI